MKNASEAQIRGKCAQLGFPNVKADTRIAMLSGGEKARLLMGLCSFHGPHLLIMDEPTNHLDIDSRAALIEAINAYKGAVILVSHDRYLLDACADRLWQVADGAVTPFDGDMDDYKAMVLGTEKPKAKGAKTAALPPQHTNGNQGRLQQALPAKKRLAALEEKMAKFQELIGRIDTALADRDAFIAQPQKAAQLAKQRGELAKALASAEDDWLIVSAELDAAQ